MLYGNAYGGVGGRVYVDVGVYGDVDSTGGVVVGTNAHV